jgi:hypothetical protein
MGRAGNPRQSGGLLALLILFLFLILLGGVIYGGFTLYKTAAKTTSSAEVFADKFLTLIQHHHFAAAHRMLVPQAQEITPASAMASIEQAEESIHGKTVAWGKPQWYIQNYNGTTYVRLTYPLVCMSGQSKVEVVMQPNGSEWQVRSFAYQF